MISDQTPKSELSVENHTEVRITPYYQHAGITIYHGDCREILPTLGRVDAVITDPPYGIGHKSNWGSTWMNTVIAGDHDTTVRDGIVQWSRDLPGVYFGTWKTPPVDGCVGCVVWDKGPAFGMGDLAFPWKASFELAYIRGRGWSAENRGEGVLRGPVMVSWESRGRSHPHQKPTWLLCHFIQRIAGTILDPFMGSGTTLVAAKQLGRRAIGIEIEEKYCEIAAKRLSQEVLFGVEIPQITKGESDVGDNLFSTLESA